MKKSNKERDAISVNLCLTEIAKALIDVSLVVENLQLKSKILDPVLSEEQVKFFSIVGDVLNPKERLTPRYKIGDSVMYSTDSSGFEFIVSEIHITLDGVFYNEEWLKQDNVHRVLES
ncbi:MAG: hypothetical protein KA146_02220 [Leptospiraceae bacterium]|nr:hypothetical protein [Leptospiraceae bacterium]